MSGHWTTRRIGERASGAGVDLYELDGERSGPTVLVLGGVHGNEVGGVAAAGQLTRTSWRLRAGQLQVVPMTHESAYAANSRVGPVDGENLARSFPGQPNGGPTERLAHLIAAELLGGADVLVDLHTSSPDTDMPLFAGCLDDGSAAANVAVELTVAFGTPVVWTHPRLSQGRTLTMAQGLNIPALYAESPVGGVLDASHINAYVSGVRRVLATLSMLDDRPPRESPSLWLHGDGDIDSFTKVTVKGLFLAETALLDPVEAGQVVGTVVDPRGQPLEHIRAPETGYVMTLRRTAHIRPGTPVAGVVPVRPTELGQPSDSIAAT